MLAAAGAAADALRRRSDLERVASELVARGRETWPAVRGVDDVQFVAHVARCIEGLENPAAALDELHGADMWLAFAAGMGNKAAIAAVDRQIAPVVQAATARMRGRVSHDDVAQLLRERLLVGRTDAPPKILEYSGRGSLGAWMRISAIRTALNMTRSGDAASAQPVTRETLLAAPAVGASPELDHFRKHYAAEFKEAFEEALAGLSAVERNLLRLSLVDGLSVDEVGVVFGVHRATAARRIAGAREAVQKATRRVLTERLKLAPAELRSIMGYIQSHLDLSLQRLLGSEEPAEDATPRPKARKSMKARASAKKPASTKASKRKTPR